MIARPPTQPTVFFNERFIMAARHEEECYKILSSRLFSCLHETIEQRRRGGQEAPYLRGYGQKLVS